MITYTVFRYGDAPGRKTRPFFVVRWKHGPPGASRGERSTKQKNRRKAEEWAARFIASLEAGQPARGATTWKAFRDAYERDRLADLPSAAGYRSALNAVEACLNPRHLADIDAESFERFRRWLRQRGKSQSTAASYQKHLRAALGWAAAHGLIVAAPAVRVGQTDVMRGRPLTAEEVDRLLAATPKVVGAANAAAWRRVLLGAWYIGLRRAEILRVWWDRDDRIQPLGLDAGTPRIHFPAGEHKAGRDALLPLLPEAADLLRQTPRKRRTGPVFLPLRGRRKLVETADGVGRTVADIGRKAGVVTGADPETGEKRYATLHDLRRSLGTRLAHEGSLSVPEVARMMRHRRIETTMAHYADLNVGVLGDKLAAIPSCTLSCTTSQRSARPSGRKSAT